MALFTDEAAVYGAFGKLFSDVLADEKTVGALVRTNTILQLQLSAPRSTVTVAVRQNQQPLVYFGKTTRRPEVFLQMDADVAHGWLVGEINPTLAFADNRIKSRGPSSQVLAILAWAKVLTPQYQAIIADNDGELPPPLAPPQPKPAPAAPEATPVEATPEPDGAPEVAAPAADEPAAAPAHAPDADPPAAEAPQSDADAGSPEAEARAGSEDPSASDTPPADEAPPADEPPTTEA